MIGTLIIVAVVLIVVAYVYAKWPTQTANVANTIVTEANTVINTVANTAANTK